MDEALILQSVEGVVLKEVSAPVPGGLTAVAYVVSSARTPEVWQFDDEAAAKVEFDAEVRRSAEAGNRNSNT